MEITANTINDVYEKALKDPSLLASLEIEDLLNTLENTNNDYLENKTLKGITDEIYGIMQTVITGRELQESICLKLVDYRLVDELHELHKGKHVRWVRRNTEKLTNGGIVVDIKFLDTGTQVLCKNSMNRFMQYKYDDCITFQKLSQTEQLILMAYEHAEQIN
tara:strand:+ start:2602 stop:3090 length:489 start_codon:yes stop_codon:yes gene_type:complete